MVINQSTSFLVIAYISFSVNARVIGPNVQNN